MLYIPWYLPVSESCAKLGLYAKLYCAYITHFFFIYIKYSNNLFGSCKKCARLSFLYNNMSMLHLDFIEWHDI